MRMLPLSMLFLLSACMMPLEPVAKVQAPQTIVVAPKPVVAKKAAPVVKKRVVPKPVVAPVGERSDRGEGGGGWSQ